MCFEELDKKELLEGLDMKEILELDKKELMKDIEVAVSGGRQEPTDAGGGEEVKRLHYCKGFCRNKMDFVYQ